MPQKRFSFFQIETVLFWLLIGLMLFPIWSNTYFLTGDGPCHLYNSKVLLDFITGTDVDFYSEYYVLNRNTEPNWFSHLSLAFLLTFLTDRMAEKVFLTVYVLLFGLLIRGIIRLINKQNTFLILLGLPFIFHHMFQMGFFNYSYGFAFCFLGIWFWLKCHQYMTWPRLMVFAFINLLTYFTHPIGFLLSGLMIGSMAMGKLVVPLLGGSDAKNATRSDTLRSFGNIILGFLPGILLMMEYLMRKGLHPKPNPDSAKYLYHELIELTSLINLHENEKYAAMALSILFGTLVLTALIGKIRNRIWSMYDGLFGAFLLMVLLYFIQPGALAGAGILSKRLQFIPYLVVFLWLAHIPYNHQQKRVTTVVGISIIIMFSVLRIPIHRFASDAVEEYVSANTVIPSRSTVLPLSFSHNGKTPAGDRISQKVWLFMHAFDYSGTDKPLVLFGNYEANTGYFPIIWKTDKNPYTYLSKGGGLEHQPPGVGIMNYESSTKSRIDYVVTWCLDEQFMEHPNTLELLKELTANYELIFTSKHQLTRVYRRLASE